MPIQLFSVLHVFSVILLIAINFYVFANPDPAKRKKTLMYSGIFSLFVFLTGFGILGMNHWGVPVWSVIKIVCWLFLSAVAGIAYRRPEKITLFLPPISPWSFKTAGFVTYDLVA